MSFRFFSAGDCVVWFLFFYIGERNSSFALSFENISFIKNILSYMVIPKRL